MPLTEEQKLIKFEYYTGFMNRHFKNESLTVYALMKIRKLQINHWVFRVTRLYDLLDILARCNNMALKEQAILILSDIEQQRQAALREESSDSSSSRQSSDCDTSDKDSDSEKPRQVQNRKKLTRDAAVQTQDSFIESEKSKDRGSIVQNNNNNNCDKVKIVKYIIKTDNVLNSFQQRRLIMKYRKLRQTRIKIFKVKQEIALLRKSLNKK